MLIRRTRNAPGDDAPDAGMTLVELVVSGALSLLVGALATAMLFSATASTRRADGQNEQAAGARAALTSWSLLLRLGVDPVGLSRPTTPRFLEIDPDSVTMCAALGSKADDPSDDELPIGVRLSLEEGRLVEDRWITCTSMLAGDPVHVHRVLASNVSLVGGSTWLVTPLARADLPDGVTGGLLGSSLVDGDQPLQITDPTAHSKIVEIAGVQLAFETRSDPRRHAPPATYSTVVSLMAGA